MVSWVQSMHATNISHNFVEHKQLNSSYSQLHHHLKNTFIKNYSNSDSSTHTRLNMFILTVLITLFIIFKKKVTVFFHKYLDNQNRSTL